MVIVEFAAFGCSVIQSSDRLPLACNPSLDGMMIMPHVYVLPSVSGLQVVNVKLGVGTICELAIHAQNCGFGVLTPKGVLDFVEARQAGATANQNQEE